jgi:hypothetical protein
MPRYARPYLDSNTPSLQTFFSTPSVWKALLEKATQLQATAKRVHVSESLEVEALRGAMDILDKNIHDTHAKASLTIGKYYRHQKHSTRENGFLICNWYLTR